MPPLKLGFNPRLVAHDRRNLLKQLRDIVDTAVRLEFNVIELNLDSMMYELGLRMFFDADFISILDDAPTRFHLNVFRDAFNRNLPSFTDPNASDRSIALRQFVQIVEFFEDRHPMEMYVVHPGRRMASEASHLDALKYSFWTIHSLFPGLPIAVQNSDDQSVLCTLDNILEMLDSSVAIRFAFHTGHAFHAVDGNQTAFESRLDYLARFSDRLAEIRWHNTAPDREPSLPLHVELQRGINLRHVMRIIGRNPGTVHMIDTVGLNPADLFREARELRKSINA